MTLPEPNTPQETAWFAEQMGWPKDNKRSVPSHTVYTIDEHLAFNGKDHIWVWDQPGERARSWNPRTSIADAIELAEKLRISFARDPDEFQFVPEKGLALIYSAWPDGEDCEGSRKFVDDLCTAICEAVRAKGGNDANR